MLRDRVVNEQDPTQVGGYNEGTERLHLKLIKHDDRTTPAGWERTRLYELKHVYDLGAKGIPNRVDPWGEHYDHDWPTWREMPPLYLS